MRREATRLATVDLPLPVGSGQPHDEDTLLSQTVD
jgi:hypothetical protein